MKLRVPHKGDDDGERVVVNLLQYAQINGNET